MISLIPIFSLVPSIALWYSMRTCALEPRCGGGVSAWLARSQINGGLSSEGDEVREEIGDQ